MTPREPEQLRREASVMKMRAARLRALGDENDRWEAILLHHQAAQKELAALELRPEPSDQEQAGARIEACGLFLETHDPVRAATPVPARKLSKKQLRSLLDVYPGIAELWWALSIRTTDEEAALAQTRMKQLDPTLEQDTVAQERWEEIEPAFKRTLTLAMDAERSSEVLLLNLVSRVAATFSELFSNFVKNNFGNSITLMPREARSGSFCFDVEAWGLPPMQSQHSTGISLTHQSELEHGGSRSSSRSCNKIIYG